MRFDLVDWFDQNFLLVAGSRVVLAPIQGLVYGRSGGWAINLWMKKQANDSSSGLYEYLFSHAAASAQSMGAYNSSTDGFADNQV